MTTRTTARADLAVPAPPGAPREVRRRPDLGRDEGQPVVELVPRVVGPGRRERAYLARQSELEGALEAARTSARTGERELEVARLLERGAGRRIDKLEGELERERGQQKRLLVAMGAMQQELAGLRARASRLSAAQERRPRSLLARLFAR